MYKAYVEHDLKTSTIIYLWLWYSWISKKPLILYGTLACCNLQFLTSIIKLIGLFHSNRKFRVLVEVKMSKHQKIKAGVPQSPVLSPIMYSLYIDDTPKPYVSILPSLPLMHINVTDLKEGLCSLESWCEC
jgi:hypothetical protein